MCHSNHSTAKNRIRIAGLQGLQGVIRKTVCDELQPDIWQQHHMDKIVPSLLYNMHSKDGGVQSNGDNDDNSANSMAERVFRDLVFRAAYSNLKSVLRPILMHMDSHNLWCKTDFPFSCFKIVMFSVQAQYGHVVVQMLMSHLDHHSQSAARLKSRITDVLSETVIVAAGGSIGPSVLDVFNSLLRHLRGSVEYNSTSQSEKLNNDKFQDSIINTIGEFANHLPDFQKIEILMFLVSKMPPPALPQVQEDVIESASNTRLQTILLKTVLKVSTTYRTVLMANAFPTSLKTPLLQISLVSRPSTRLIVQRILHTLIDRHDNADKIDKIWIPEVISELDLNVEKPSRQDVHFMKHSGIHILWHLVENFRLPNNTREIIEALYISMCLLLTELLADDTHVEFASFILQLQNLAVTGEGLSPRCQYQIHSVVLCFASLYSELSEFISLQSHIGQVVQKRRDNFRWLLPEVAIYGAEGSIQAGDIDDECLISDEVLRRELENNGYDVSSLTKPLKTPDHMEGNISSKESDLGSVSNLEIESLDTSPALQRNSLVGRSTDCLTFNQLKIELQATDSDDLAAADAKRNQLYEEFQSAPLETIMNRANSKNDLKNRLSEILQDSSEGEDLVKPVAIDNITYPAMFVY